MKVVILIHLNKSTGDCWKLFFFFFFSQQFGCNRQKNCIPMILLRNTGDCTDSDETVVRNLLLSSVNDDMVLGNRVEILSPVSDDPPRIPTTTLGSELCLILYVVCIYLFPLVCKWYTAWTDRYVMPRILSLILVNRIRTYRGKYFFFARKQSQ